MKPNIGIANNHMQAIAKLLNVLPADEFTLYAKTRNCHWNVTGASCSEMRKF